MNLLRLSTRLHKWVALAVGIQILFWVFGGLVMTVLPIERVRGEHRVAEAPAEPLDLAAVLTPAEAAMRAGIRPSAAQLKATPRGPVWVLTPPEGAPVTVSAADGAPLPPMTEAEATAAATRAYRGEARVVSVERLARAPVETRREGPLWRVDFDDAEGTTFYLSPETGEVVSRRSDLWRFYDLFWRLHAMDWRTGENFNHPLIIVTTALTLVVVVTGFVLLWVRLARDLRAAQTGRPGVSREPRGGPS